MNYLILSPIGLSIFLVPRLCASKDVEKVYFHVLDPEKRATGKGMDNYPGWEKLVLVADYAEVLNSVSKDNLIIVIDDIGIGELGKFLRNSGFKVIGGSPLADKIEDDRDFATNLMKKFMDVPETVSFDSFEAGIKFAKGLQKDTRLIFKPNDSQAGKEYTYVSQNINDLVSAMTMFKSEWKWKESFQLQQFVKGIEVDFSAYLNAKGEYLPDSMFLYFENKKLMSGDIGAMTGGMIAVHFARELKGIFADILEKFKPYLVKDGYYGQISINAIVSEETKTPHFLEFCGRFGYPSFPIDITALEEKGKTVHQLFSALAQGETPRLFATDKINVTCSVGVPPFPLHDGIDKQKGVPVSWDKKYDRYFFPYYISHEEKKGMVVAGVDGWVLQVTCSDATLDGAVSMLYDSYMPTLKLKNALYRDDLGKDAKKRIKSLRELKVI